MSRLKDFYETQLRDEIKKELGINNTLAVPRLEKIVLNMGVGRRAVQDSKAIQAAKEDLALIAGQNPVVTKAKNSIAAFKLREGMPIGVKVTLRKKRMYDFMERLTTMALPRVRNYQGASSKSFDGNGNYSLGVPEHTVFYEVDYNKVSYTMGLDIVFVTTAHTKKGAFLLLKGLGIPLKGEC